MSHRSGPAERNACICVPELVRAWVTTRRYETAIRDETEHLTHEELDELASSLANRLFECGVRPGSLVAVLMRRTPLCIAALLAIWKTGAAYLPLDPESPSEWLASALGELDVGLILSETKHLPLLSFLPDSPGVLCLDNPSAPLKSTRPPDIDPHADDLAYVLYTSGSTGRPKAVEVCHSNLANVLVEIAKQLRLLSGEVMLAHSAVGFDVFNLEIYLPLITGGSSYLTESRGVGIGARLIRSLAQSGATTMLGTPALWQLLLQAGWKGNRTLRAVCGGEALPLPLAKTLVALCSRVWNQYGPTEATICSTSTEIYATTEKITIGRPIPNVTVYILDSRLQPVPPGAIGEGFIGGAGVARGYRNMPELTTASFLIDPFSSKLSARMYRTGDLLRELPDGTLEFRGRLDNQVKVGGHRIALEEIEEIIRNYPGIESTAVSIVALEHGGQRLVAWVVSEGVFYPEPVRVFLKKYLPVYLIPSEFRQLRSLPINVNGKVDRSILNASFNATGDTSSEPDLSSGDELEETLRSIWQDLLQITPISSTANFFDLGGDSLLGTLLVLKINKQLGCEITPDLLIECPDIRSLASHIRKDTLGKRRRHLVHMRAQGSRAPLFMVSGLGSSALLFRSFSADLGDDQPFYVLTLPTGVVTNRNEVTIESLASCYLEEIRAVSPTGPYQIGGHSLGGLIAFEMAQQLSKMNLPVGLLALLDSNRNPRSVSDSAAQKPKSLLATMHYGRAKIGALIETGFIEVAQRRIKSIRLKYRTRIAQKVLANGGPQSGLEADELLILAAGDYQSFPYPGGAVLFRAKDQVGCDVGDALGWENLFQQGLKVIDVPGRHLTMFDEPNVTTLATRVTEELNAVVEKSKT